MPAKSLPELLPRAHVVLPLNAVTFEEAVAALTQQLVAAGAIRASTRADSALAPRRSNVVSIGPRVALPHYRTDLVDQLVVAMGISPVPIHSDNAEIEGEPTIIVLVIAPTDSSTLYLQTVAAIARLLRDDSVVDRIAGAKSVDEVFGIEELSTLRVQPSLTVRDIMIHDVNSIAPAIPLRDAVDLMVRNHISALPVVGDKLEILGIITEHDVMRGLLSRIPRVADADRDTSAESSELLRVRDVMTRSVLCVSEDLGLTEAANLMNNKNIEQVPVTSEGKLTGFLTRGDIIRKLFAR
jgi:CBS domain-containing protein